MVLLLSLFASRFVVLVGTSLFVWLGCHATTQGADITESVVLPAGDTCAVAQAREKQWQADVTRRINSPFLNAKRSYQGDQADLIYYCGNDDRIVLRHIFLRFPDAQSAELAFNRQLSAVTKDLGRPCVALDHAMRDVAQWESLAILSSDGRRTVVWNVRPGSNAILMFFPGDAKRPWQIQLLFNALAHLQLSDEAVRMWQAHGCDVPRIPDSELQAVTTLFIH